MKSGVSVVRRILKIIQQKPDERTVFSLRERTYPECFDAVMAKVWTQVKRRAVRRV